MQPITCYDTVEVSHPYRLVGPGNNQTDLRLILPPPPYPHPHPCPPSGLCVFPRPCPSKWRCCTARKRSCSARRAACV